MGRRGEGSVVTATGDDFIRLLANLLTRIVSANAENQRSQVSCFNSINAPPISDYVVRISRYVHCSNECFVLALVYIDRIMKLHKDFTVTIVNIHRLLITAVMLAAKFSDDVYYSNSFYAQVGGIKVSEINLLEAKFLMLINYKLYVNANDYENCRKGVEKANNIPRVNYYFNVHVPNHDNRLKHFNRCYSNTTVSTSAEFDDEFTETLKNKFDECEAFVNALESRYRDNLKRKCSHNVNNWDYQYLSLLQWNKLKRNTW